MKPLFLLFLLAIPVHAQTLADLARKERERQAKMPPTLVITSDGRQTAAAPPADGTTSPADARPQAPTEDQKSAVDRKPLIPSPPAAVQDPVVAYNTQLEKLRSRIRELQDQETSLQLQISQITNQIFAPVIDQASKDQAQIRLGEAQQRLSLTRVELDQTRKILESAQLQGPLSGPLPK